MGIGRLWRIKSARAAMLAAMVLGVVGGVMGPYATALGRARNATSPAFAARVMSVNETARMHLVGRPGHAFNEQGQASGTFVGSAAGHFVALTGSSGKGTFIIKTRSGTLTGYAVTRGHVVGAIGYFKGTMHVTGGTGKWSHASGALRCEGKLNRQTFAVSEQAHGQLHV